VQRSAPADRAALMANVSKAIIANYRP
jgi:hypothetical protein